MSMWMRYCCKRIHAQYRKKHDHSAPLLSQAGMSVEEYSRAHTLGANTSVG